MYGSIQYCANATATLPQQASWGAHSNSHCCHTNKMERRPGGRVGVSGLCDMLQLLLQDTDREAEVWEREGKSRQGLADLSRSVRRPSDHRASSSGTLRCSIKVALFARWPVKISGALATLLSRHPGRLGRRADFLSCL